MYAYSLSSGIGPGKTRIAFEGQTNSQSWHDTHFSRPCESFTSVGAPRYPTGSTGDWSGYSSVTRGLNMFLNVINRPETIWGK